MILIDIDPVSSLKSLLSHNDKLSVTEILEQAVNSLLLSKCLVAMGWMDDIQTTDMAAVLYKYLGTVRCNGHQVDDGLVDEGGCQVILQGIGSAIYPVLPLLNHSCDSNTVRVYVGNKVMLIATR